MKKPGRKPHRAPAARDATVMTTSSSQLGILPPRQIMQVVEARQPMRTWPSAPMFQKRILKAGVTAREMPSRMATFSQVVQLLRAVPKAPLRMVP